jgi:hypothetical protein
MPRPTLIAPKLIHLDTIGTLLGVADFQSKIELGHSAARPLFKVRKKNGAQWTAAFVEGVGLAIVSHQTHRVYVIDCRTFVDLACEAGVEDQAGLLVIPKEHRP